MGRWLVAHPEARMQPWQDTDMQGKDQGRGLESLARSLRSVYVPVNAQSATFGDQESLQLK
jgi:hypothetical protein